MWDEGRRREIFFFNFIYICIVENFYKKYYLFCILKMKGFFVFKIEFSIILGVIKKEERKKVFFLYV